MDLNFINVPDGTFHVGDVVDLAYPDGDVFVNGKFKVTSIVCDKVFGVFNSD